MAYTKIEDLPEITELSPTEELIIQTPTGTKRIKANLLKDEELAQKVNELGSSLIDIYVGDDGKLHKVKGGADTVLPFNGVKYLGQFTRDPWYNENGFIIRDAYENYKNITIDNIIVFPVSLGCYFANPHTAGGPYSIEFTYNNDTGVITDSMIGMPTQASMSIDVAKVYIIE